MKNLFRNAFCNIKNNFLQTHKIARFYVTKSLEMIITCYFAQFVFISALEKIENISLFGYIETAKSLNESLVLSFVIAIVLGMVCDKAIKEQEEKS